jgi:parallel beta-helix repeat protein
MTGILVDPIISGFSFNSLIGTTTIENNVITNNKLSGITLGSSFPVIISGNTITENSVGLDISAYSNQSIMTNNNIYENANISIKLEASTLTSINASNNWWGTTDTTAISQSIYDSKNNSGLGTVIFMPVLSTPIPQTIPIPKHPATTNNTQSL